MFVAPLALHVIEGDVVIVGDERLDALHVDGLARARRNDIGEQPRRLFGIDRPLVHGGEGLHACKSAFELADVALHFVRDEAEDVFWNQGAVVAELGMENGEASLEIRGLDVGDEAPFESRPQPVLEGRDFLGRTIRRDDDLLVDLMEGVEGVEELIIRPVFAG